MASKPIVRVIQNRTLILPDDWRTPATDYPLRQVGSARIRRTLTPPLVGFAQGDPEIDFIKTVSPTPVTYLQAMEGDGWKTWMLDDPMHWESIKRYAERVRPGRVLVAGLGLGLICWALLQRDDIEDILVMERNSDVLHCVRPLLPKDERLRLGICWDFWDYLETVVSPGEFSTLFIDLWRGPLSSCLPDVIEKSREVQQRFPYPETESLFFLFQDQVDAERALWGLK